MGCGASKSKEKERGGVVASSYTLGFEAYQEAEDARERSAFQTASESYQVAITYLLKSKKEERDDDRVTTQLARAYLKQGDVFKDLNKPSDALKSYNEAEKLGADAKDRKAALASKVEDETPVAGPSASSAAPAKKASKVPVPERIFPKNSDFLNQTEQQQAPKDLANPKTTEELVISLESMDRDNPIYDDLMNAARAVISIFSKERVKSQDLIDEAVALSLIADKEIIHELLSKFTTALSLETKLLETHLLSGLAQIVGQSNPAMIKRDDLVQILKVVTEKVNQTHQQFDARENSDDHLEILKTLSRLLDAMSDVGIEGLSRTSLHEPLYDALAAYLEAPDYRLNFAAAYCRQALVRLPNDESKWKSFLRRSISAGKGVWAIVSAVKDQDVSQLLSAYENFSAAYKHQESEQVWYDDLRYAQLLARAKKCTSFEDWIKKKAPQAPQPFVYGSLNLIDDFVGSADNTISISALSLLQQCALHAEFWATHIGLSDKIKGKLFTKQLWTKKEDFCKEVEKRMAAHCHHYNADIRGKAESLLEGIPNAKPLPSKGVEIGHRPSMPKKSTRLLQVAKKSDLYGSSIQGLLERHRQRVFDNPEISAELELYIPSLATRSANDNESFDILKDVDDFLAHDQHTVLLLLGSSGTGKSLLGRYLERSLWDKQKGNEQGKKIIPFFISLPATVSKNSKENLIETAFSRAGFNADQIKDLKDSYEFLFILDGYDEIQGKINLYMQHGFEQWRGKVMISCRKEYLLNSSQTYTYRFAPSKGDDSLNHALRERFLLSFSDEQIDAYLQRYVKHRTAVWSDWEQYRKTIDSIHGLKRMIETPYLLAMTAQVLPEVMNKHQGSIEALKLTRTELYDRFLNQWFARSINKLTRQNQIDILGDDPREEMNTWLKSLADLMFRKNVYPAVYNKSAADAAEWKPFFDNDEKTMAIRLACPLKKEGENSYGFVHKSLYEFLVGQAGGEELNIQLPMVQSTKGAITVASSNTPAGAGSSKTSASRSPLLENTQLNQQLINEEDGIIRFYVEKVETDPLFQEQLWALVYSSRKNSSMKIGAANAMTILNAAQINFSNKDLSGIKIQHADLSGALLDNTNLVGSDLTGVDFTGSWMRNTNLSHAQLHQIKFNELAPLNIPDFSFVEHTRDGRYIAIVGEEKSLYLYDLQTRLLKVLFDQKNKKTERAIFDPAGKYLAVDFEDNSICFWNMLSGDHGTFLGGKKTPFQVIGFDDSSQCLIFKSMENTFQLYNPSSLVFKSAFKSATDFEAPRFYVHGTTLVIGSPRMYDQPIELWSTRSGILEKSLSSCREKVSGFTFDKQGEFLAVVLGDLSQSISLWNIKTGSLENSFYNADPENPDDSSISDIHFDNSGKFLAAVVESREIFIWNILSGSLEKRLTPPSNVTVILYNLDGSRLACGSETGELYLWNTHSWLLEKVFQGQELDNDTNTQGICRIFFNSDESFLVSVGYNKAIRFWRMPSVGLEKKSDYYLGDVIHIAVDPTGKYLASKSVHGGIHIWDITSGSLQRELESNSIYFTFDSTGKFFCFQETTFLKSSISVWDDLRKEPSKKIQVMRAGYLTFNPANTYLAIGGGGAELLDTTSFTRKYYFPRSHSVFDIDHNFICFDVGKVIEVWDIQKNTLERTLDNNTSSDIKGIGYDPIGFYLYSNSYDTLFLWNIKFWTLERTIKFSGFISRASFNPLGQEILVSCEKKASLIDIQSGNIEVVGEGIDNAIWDSTGKRILSTDKGVIQCWSLEKQLSNKPTLSLFWATHQKSLYLKDVNIENSTGLSTENKALLQPHGAAGFKK